VVAVVLGVYLGGYRAATAAMAKGQRSAQAPQRGGWSENDEERKT
jgi:hypothetical protein